jgi:hypothetical protein
MPTPAEIILALRKRNKRMAGEDGEDYAAAWLNRNNWKFEKINQDIGTVSIELRDHFGGKRPDFLVNPNDQKITLFIDAKYHQTAGCKSFTLRNAEIAMYRGLKSFVESLDSSRTVEILFMVFPKECDGKKFVWVSLENFDSGIPVIYVGELATMVTLPNQDDLWCHNEV